MLAGGNLASLVKQCYQIYSKSKQIQSDCLWPEMTTNFSSPTRMSAAMIRMEAGFQVSIETLYSSWKGIGSIETKYWDCLLIITNWNGFVVKKRAFIKLSRWSNKLSWWDGKIKIWGIVDECTVIVGVVSPIFLKSNNTATTIAEMILPDQKWGDIVAKCETF